MKKILALVVMGLLLYTGAGITGSNEKNNMKIDEAAIAIPGKIEKNITLQPVVKNVNIGDSGERNEPFPAPWGWVWMGIFDTEWEYLMSFNQNGTDEGGIGIDITYKIIGIGVHHIEIWGYYGLFGKDLKDRYGKFSFPEDSFIFIKKEKTIPLTFIGADGASVDIFLSIDGEKWWEKSISIP